MTTKADVIALHTKHPDWDAPKIAKKLGCLTAYVRAIKQRCKLDIPQGAPGGGPMSPEAKARFRLRYALGNAALAAGLTVRDIERLAKSASA